MEACKMINMLDENLEIQKQKSNRGGAKDKMRDI